MPDSPQHKAIELPAVICGYTRRKDRSVSIRIATQCEAGTDLIQWLDERQDRSEVTVLIADDPEAQALAYEGPKDAKGRAMSQQLRGALYGQHKALLEAGVRNVPESWEVYYAMRMEELVQDALA